MTIEEFNEKYKAYLGKRWYGLDIDDAEVINFLDNLFEHYLIKIEGFEYHQIKVKFGDVRFYSNLASNSTNDTLVALIEAHVKLLLRLKDLEGKLDNVLNTIKNY
jgi:hypothetical protein